MDVERLIDLRVSKLRPIFEGEAAFDQVVDLDTAAAFALRDAGLSPVRPGVVPWADVAFITAQATRAIQDGRLTGVGSVRTEWGDVATVERNAFLEWAIRRAGDLALNPVLLQRMVSPLPRMNSAAHAVWQVVRDFPSGKLFTYDDVQDAGGPERGTISKWLKELRGLDLVRKEGRSHLRV